MCRRRPSASSEAFGALVALGFADRDGGHGDLMKMMDAIAAKLYPARRLAVRKNAVEATLVSSCSEPRRLLLGDGSADTIDVQVYVDRFREPRSSETVGRPVDTVS